MADGAVLTTRQAWERCVGRRERLTGMVLRFGLLDQVDDVVHDAFVAVMGMPRLYPAGFDALLETVLWRRCLIIAAGEAARQRLVEHAALHPPATGDHADRVVDQVHAQWLLRRSGVLTEPDIWMLEMVSVGYRRQEIADMSGRTVDEIDRAMRSVRRRARYKTQATVA
ncbi:hypothetical protein [Actinokineospora diospyrosa]|uniref:DNA-directed RNA polymerase specialized sigma subunit, sigma24 family n=1 Tax=Actinokineospora diospyrosa TaxID=103728 RepID=A0ABT1IHP5_9PSEU|nr:hypothetical protein [Actinokineospora diospyrosa]MCP2272144.1 DNA-directed RNA polymerase specialized sigma subunit, sigma24 family [Actinokineospora diospyrosa]